jgi:hypothetical protein
VTTFVFHEGLSQNFLGAASLMLPVINCLVCFVIEAVQNGRPLRHRHRVAILKIGRDASAWRAQLHGGDFPRRWRIRSDVFLE